MMHFIDDEKTLPSIESIEYAIQMLASTMHQNTPDEAVFDEVINIFQSWHQQNLCHEAESLLILVRFAMSGVIASNCRDVIAQALCILREMLRSHIEMDS